MKYSVAQNFKFKKVRDIKSHMAQCKYELDEKKIIANMTEWYLANYKSIYKINRKVS